MWDAFFRPTRSFLGKTTFVVMAIAFLFAWSVLASNCFVAAFGAGYYGKMRHTLLSMPPHHAYILLLPQVALEEALRIFLLAALLGAAGASRTRVVVGTLVTAAAFGMAHLSNGIPLASVLVIQGMAGVVFNVMYLKFGGLHDAPSDGFKTAFATHYAFDALLVTLSAAMA